MGCVSIAIPSLPLLIPIQKRESDCVITYITYILYIEGSPFPTGVFISGEE